ncbi:hypothetical protein PQX77_018013 [Marasmius sp. AFHP31]|nr:hypothetical protein PQX77_018013 [Marasmius sp. AFHP31]
MSDSDTMCSVSDMSEISDTTVVDPMEFPAPLPPVDPLYYLEPPAESYLAQKRYDDFKEHKKNHPREFSLIPLPFQIEFAFKDFVNAVSRAYLTARATPAFRTTVTIPPKFPQQAPKSTLSAKPSPRLTPVPQTPDSTP